MTYHIPPRQCFRQFVGIRVFLCSAPRVFAVKCFYGVMLRHKYVALCNRCFVGVGGCVFPWCFHPMCVFRGQSSSVCPASRLCDLVMVCHIIAMFYAAGVSWVCVVVCFRGVVITFLCILATSVRARDSC